MKYLTTFVCLLTLLLAGGVAAQDDADAFSSAIEEPELGPYEARIVVESQTDSVRLRAMSEGLRQVIVNLLGNEDAAYEPEISSALRAPQQYVVQFSYERGYPEEADENDSGYNVEPSADPAADTECELQTFLNVQFLQGRVDSLLQAADQIEVGELQIIDIEVQGIVDFADYASTLTGLKNLAMVREVSPVMIADERVQFSLQFEGDVQRFTAMVEEKTRLQSLDVNIDPVFADQLNYELRPEIININD